MRAKEITRRKPSVAYSLTILAVITAFVLLGNKYLHAPMEPLFLIAWLFLFPACMHLGYSFTEIEDAVKDYCKKSLGVVFILIGAGAIIGTWMASGTVPALIYYSLQIVSPSLFLLINFTICFVISMSIGTAWGTAGTAGIAMFAVGETLGIPSAMTVGAIISGCFIGDIWSPMATSTNSSAAACGTDIRKHVREISIIGVPVTIICAVFYYFLGMQFSNDNFDTSNIESISKALELQFNLGWITMIPLVVFIILFIFKMPPLFAMVLSSLTACVVGVVYQGIPTNEIVASFWTGYKTATGDAFLDSLVNRGGIQSMFGTILMMFFAFGMMGAFDKVGILDTLVTPISKKAKTVLQITLVTQIITIIGNLLSANSFAIIMAGTLMKPTYEEHNLDLVNLSKAVNATSATVAVLVPWSITGIFLYGLFGVSVFSYAPYALLSYITPILVFLLVLFKVRVLPANNESIAEGNLQATQH